MVWWLYVFILFIRIQRRFNFMRYGVEPIIICPTALLKLQKNLPMITEDFTKTWVFDLILTVNGEHRVHAGYIITNIKTGDALQVSKREWDFIDSSLTNQRSFHFVVIASMLYESTFKINYKYGHWEAIY